MKLNKKNKFIIQFNEANFSLIKKYVDKYPLDGLKKILDLSTVIHTTSENEYDKLEPWIQWYSFYSNLKFSEHKVLHLGDCLKTSHKLFTEELSINGNDVGIFGSMNLRPFYKYKIYIPDAWTNSRSDDSFSSRIITSTLKQIINKNTKLSLSMSNVIGIFLLIGIPRSLQSIKIIIKSLTSFFLKSRAELASLFDYFFTIYSLKRAVNNKLDISFIFMNGLAHVQHHYMLNSEFVGGTNPSWYVDKNKDPVLNSIKIYDELFKYLFKKYEKSSEIWIITGLTQYPYENPMFYWRFDNHYKVLSNFLKFKFTVNPRMTRDFEIVVDNSENFIKVYDFLKNAKILDGRSVSSAFGHIDKVNNNSIFSSFIYEKEQKDICLSYNEITIPLYNLISFVAIKNGGHDNRGWVYSNKKEINDIDHTKIWNLSDLIFKTNSHLQTN